MENDFMKEFTHHVNQGEFDRAIQRIVLTAESAALLPMRGNKAEPDFYLVLGLAASHLLSMAEGMIAMRAIKTAYRMPDNECKCLKEEFKNFYNYVEHLKEADEIKEMLTPKFKELYIDQ